MNSEKHYALEFKSFYSFMFKGVFIYNEYINNSHVLGSGHPIVEYQFPQQHFNCFGITS